MTQYGVFRKDGDGEAEPYAMAFGEGSRFKPRTPVTEANENPVDELSRVSRANFAAAKGLLSSIFGSKRLREKKKINRGGV